MWLLLIALIALVAAFFLKKQNNKGAGPLSLLGLVLVVLNLLFSIWGGSPAERRLEEGRSVMIDGLTQSLAERHPGARFVLLGTTGLPEDNFLVSTYKHIEVDLSKALSSEGFSVERAGFPNASSLDPQAVTEWLMDGELAGAETLNTILQDLNGKADVVVVVLPIASDIQPEDLPLKGEAPHLVLLASPGWPDLPSAIETTVLDTVLVNRSGGESDREGSEFDRRYTLVTPISGR